MRTRLKTNNNNNNNSNSDDSLPSVSAIVYSSFLVVVGLKEIFTGEPASRLFVDSSKSKSHRLRFQVRRTLRPKKWEDSTQSQSSPSKERLESVMG